MPDYGPETPLSYRQEVARQFFTDYVRAGESCMIVGLAGGGMTRLVDFLVRPDVQALYLAGVDNPPLLLKVDCNRVEEISDWGLCEVMLTTLVEGCSRRAEMVSLRPELGQMRTEVITTRNPLLALRNLELAVNILIEQKGTHLYFVFNSFDELFRELPDLALNHLRALRDAHKYELNYALCLHQAPELLNPARKDKLSARILQNVLMVGHYSEAEAQRMIEQVIARRGVALSPAAIKQIIRLSGRHAGLVQGVFNSLAGLEGELSDRSLVERLLDHSPALIECQRVWDNLSNPEKDGLKAVVKDSPLEQDIERLLERKHLVQVQGRQAVIFSPLFAQFVRRQDSSGPLRLSVDSRAHLVCIGTRVIPDVSPLVFKLLEYLYQHVGEACRRDEIIEAVYYPSQDGVSDEALASLVRQARQLIEPQDDSYHFLLTVRGIGYRLLATPQFKEPETE